MRTEEYVINDCGVCTNPEITARYDNKPCQYIVKVALLDGLWRFGADMSLHESGFGDCYSIRGTGFQTKREATDAGLERCRAYAGRQLREYQERGTRNPLTGEYSTAKSLIADLKNILAEIARQKSDNRQLTLFDL